MKQDVSKYVGQQIKNFRKLKKMTQKELGLQIGKNIIQFHLMKMVQMNLSKMCSSQLHKH